MYISTFFHIDFAISGFMIIDKKVFLNIINKIIMIIKNTHIITKSNLFIKSIFQNNKLFISKLKFHINHITNIHIASPN